MMEEPPKIQAVKVMAVETRREEEERLRNFPDISALVRVKENTQTS